MPLSSDIYDIADYINQVKKDYIPEDESTLILGIFGYLGDILTKTTQNNIVMSAETSNEGIGIKAKYEKNIIAHAFTAGIKNIYAIPSTMTVLMAFNEAELFPESNSTSQKFVFDSNNKIFFGDFEFHPDYNILITKTRLNSTTATGQPRYAYSAQYYIESDSNENKKKNPISNVTDTNIYLSPPSIIRSSELKILYIQVPIRQVERYIINKKIVTNNIIESKVFSFDYSAQLAGFTVDVVKADGTNLRLVPVYDGIATDEKFYLYYQFMNTNLIRCKFVDSIYQPNINDQIYINLQTSQGYKGNFYWNDSSYPRFVFDSISYGLMNPDGTFNGYNAISCQIIPVTTEASGGLDKKSIKELRTIIAKEELARNSITSLTDLKNFFNQINNDEVQVYTYKKRDNQFERLYYAYLLMKNSQSNIIPTNTIGFNVHENGTNLSEDGTTVTVNKNDIIEYKYDNSDPDHPTTDGEIINDSVDPDLFGSCIDTLSNHTIPNYKSGTYYIKYVSNTWKFYGTDSTYTTALSNIASLEAIGITYTGVSETIVVNYNYAYNAAVNAFLPTGVTYKVNNKTFKEAVNNVEGSYNFLYTKYINSSTISETGSDIISATVDNSILGRRLDLNDGNPTQTFIFTYDTSVNNWIYVTSIVDLADYGISFVGTPHNNDTITVVANVSTGWSLDYVGVNPANYGITISAGALVIGNRLSVTFAYNTNYAYVDRSTTAFFIDDIIINTDRYRSAVNDDTNNIVFTYLSSNPDYSPNNNDFINHIDNEDYYLIKYTENSINAGGIIPSDISINRRTFFKSIYVIDNVSTPSVLQFNEGTYKYRCTDVSDMDGVNIGSSTWMDLQSGEEYTFATGDPSSTLLTDIGLSIDIDDYQVSVGKQLYSNSTCTTPVSTAATNICDSSGKTVKILKLINNSGSYYYESANSTKYYVAQEDVEIGINRQLKVGDTIEIAFTLWRATVGGVSQFCNLDDFGITLVSSTPSPADTLTTRLHLSSMNTEKETSLFYYECPYDITINKNPLIAYYKLASFNIEKVLNFNYINENAVYQFISSAVTINRSYTKNKNIYTITVKAKLNVEEDTDLITMYGSNVVDSKIKCVLWLYDTYDDTTPSRYTFGNLVNYNENDFIFTYEFKLETDNQVNEENKLSITDKELYIVGDGRRYGQYFDNNIKAEIVFAFASSVVGTEETTQDLIEVVPTLSKYIMANSYYINDGLDLFFNFSPLINSKAVAETDNGLPNIYRVPTGIAYYGSPYYIAVSGKTYYADSSYTTSVGTLSAETRVFLDADSKYYVNLEIGGVIGKYYIKPADVTVRSMYTVASGKTYYSNKACTTSAGTTSATTPVKVSFDDSVTPSATVNGNLPVVYSIDVGGTERYVRFTDLGTNGSFINTTYTTGSTSREYSSENLPDGYGVIFDSTHNVCMIKTTAPTNSIYFVNKNYMTTQIRYYYMLDEIPCIRHGYIDNEDTALEFLNKIISEKNYLEYCTSVIEDNFSVDFKFFNTYGPSYLYSVSPNGTNIIDKVNISLEFNLSLTSNYDNNILSMIVKDIKDYIEDITKLQDIHMINITNYIANKYPDSIVYFEFVSANGHTTWKHIYNTQEDDSSYYVSEHTPEFLNVNNSTIVSGNSSSIEPDIVINVV